MLGWAGWVGQARAGLGRARIWALGLIGPATGGWLQRWGRAEFVFPRRNQTSFKSKYTVHQHTAHSISLISSIINPCQPRLRTSSVSPPTSANFAVRLSSAQPSQDQQTKHATTSLNRGNNSASHSVDLESLIADRALPNFAVAPKTERKQRTALNDVVAREYTIHLHTKVHGKGFKHVSSNCKPLASISSGLPPA